jgi:predicted P-loop ATPase
VNELVVPDDLTERDQWVMWRREHKTKSPYRVDDHKASTTDSKDWSDYPTVLKTLQNRPDHFAGVGYVFSKDDPYVGVDLDNCLEAGKIKPWAQPIIETFSDTYAEVSPSRNGVKIFAKAKLAGRGKRKVYDHHAIEIYDRGRFFTVTGEALNGAPLTIEDHQADIDALYESLEHPSRSGRAPKGGKIPKGERHDSLVSLAGTMRRRGMSVQAIDAGLWAENCERCEPPYDRQHIRQIAESAAPWKSESIDEWQTSLLRGGPRKQGEQGAVRAVLANAITALREAPEWAGVLGFNEFSLGTELRTLPPWVEKDPGVKWSDHHDRLTANWLQQAGIMVSVDVAGQAVQAVARDRRFHPVREYLDSLKWDGTKRIHRWLSVYAGAEPTDYTAAVGARWLISAVARVYRPGAKADCALILEGQQGLLKSTLLEVIGRPWFTDEIADLGSKDASLQTRGVWIIELSELDSIDRTAVSRIKSFMSRSTDRFRPPYGKHLIESPRQCVFAGTVNQSTYLRDETGGRRFWPVLCKQIFLEELCKYRDQLWAEAAVDYRHGSVWWLDSAELNQAAAIEQSDRYEGDPWVEVIQAWVQHPTQRYELGHPVSAVFTSDRESVTVADVLAHGIGKRQEQWSQADKKRVARSLVAINWERFQKRSGNRREWRYREAGS